MTRLSEKYKKEVIPAMMQKFGYKNPMAVPKILKVTINSGFGKQTAGKPGQEAKKIYENIINDLALISGQKPVLSQAKKSISAFKLREGTPVGAVVVLRKNKMYDFIDRFTSVALPRSRDFRGIDPKAVDQNGNLTVGIKEHIIFPEVSPENVKSIFGLEVTIVTNAKNKEKGLALLKLMGFPIK